MDVECAVLLIALIARLSLCLIPYDLTPSADKRSSLLDDKRTSPSISSSLKLARMVLLDVLVPSISRSQVCTFSTLHAFTSIIGWVQPDALSQISLSALSLGHLLMLRLPVRIGCVSNTNDVSIQSLCVGLLDASK